MFVFWLNEKYLNVKNFDNCVCSQVENEESEGVEDANEAENKSDEEKEDEEEMNLDGEVWNGKGWDIMESTGQIIV